MTIGNVLYKNTDFNGKVKWHWDWIECGTATSYRLPLLWKLPIAIRHRSHTAILPNSFSKWSNCIVNTFLFFCCPHSRIIHHCADTFEGVFIFPDNTVSYHLAANISCFRPRFYLLSLNARRCDTWFFPKQVYLWGVLTPLKEVHPRAAWFFICLRACYPAWSTLWMPCPHDFTFVSELSPLVCHLSPSMLWMFCLPAWFYICLPLVSHLFPTELGMLCPHDFTFVSHLSPTCLRLLSYSICRPHLQTRRESSPHSQGPALSHSAAWADVDAKSVECKWCGKNKRRQVGDKCKDMRAEHPKRTGNPPFWNLMAVKAVGKPHGCPRRAPKFYVRFSERLLASCVGLIWNSNTRMETTFWAQIQPSSSTSSKSRYPKTNPSGADCTRARMQSPPWRNKNITKKFA